MSDRLRILGEDAWLDEFVEAINPADAETRKATRKVFRTILRAFVANMRKHRALTEQPDATAPASAEWRTVICGLPIVRKLLSGQDVTLETFKVNLIPDDVLFNAKPRELPPVAPYKGPIKQPCSACSAGDAAMEHHDHEYVKLEFRGAAPAAPPAQVLSEEQVRQAMKEVQTGEHYYARLTEKLNALLRSPASTSGKETP